MNNNEKSTLLMMAVCALASCINDESDYGNEGSIPSLKVSGDDQTAMPVYNFNLGETVVINPEINYSGNAADLTYHWQVGTYTNSVKGKLEDAGNERSLTYSFEQGGTYYAHLNVTDGRVGKAVDYQINVNRTFEQGYVLVSNDAQGNGNLAFVSIPTKEGEKPILMEHCLERMNDGMTMRNLLGMEVYTITWPSTITRVFVLGQDKGYCIDANTFSVLTEIDYSEIYPGFKATQESNDASAVYVPLREHQLHRTGIRRIPGHTVSAMGKALCQPTLCGLPCAARCHLLCLCSLLRLSVAIRLNGRNAQRTETARCLQRC